ncbi:transposase, IS605 OrfB family, central region [Halorientalis persicus]|uniref:Transposase, IS605 OrfB family, central region n=1 Tax=Halorientalis persicus TaxID=1367881 RepID=A0A1H8U1G6_9EURY|nr:RNA-guided endonuclease TnpB family protein [Halorientalis persicus]SEO96896.1 transposase, IS605 OrfB family, central region [Halorientalis persicus]
MEVRRTLPVKLDVADSDRDALLDTISQYKHIANETSDHCWNENDYKQTAKYAVKDELYHDLKADHDLTANLVQQAIFQAVEAIKSGVARLEKNEDTSQPEFTADTARYDKRAATFHDDHVSLSTVDGRIEADYVLPADETDTPFEEYLNGDDWEFRTSTLHYKPFEGEFWLHIGFKRIEEETDSTYTDAAVPENRTVLGIDLGVETLAVASTGTFWTGDELDHWHREFQQRRADLQQAGTQEAHRTLQRVSTKETAYYKQYLHIVANEIVEEAVEHDCSVIAFEDLTDIRKRAQGATWHHRWRFNRLYEYVEYKAKAYGIDVEELERSPQAKTVPAYYTSQRCSSCGFTHEDNRPTQEHFECQKCGYENHADYNAAKNVAVRWCRRLLRRNQTGGDGGAPVNVALNGGTMNVNV